MLKLGAVLTFASVLLVAVAAGAQGTVVTSVQARNGGGAATGSTTSQVTVHLESGFGTVGGFVGGFGGQEGSGVRNLPFSADVIDETDQFFADGNHIHREYHGRIFRDSEGRSRTEMEFGGELAGTERFLHVTIMDPVAGSYVVLGPQQKTATVHHLGQDASMGSETRMIQRPASPAPKKVEGNAPQSATPRIAPSSRHYVREDLGTTQMEGYTVQGRRFTTTMDAGVMGNDKPMTTTIDRWFLEDLKIELLTKTQSPLAGQHVHRLVNIHTGDPDPLLFQVPADYVVQELPQK